MSAKDRVRAQLTMPSGLIARLSALTALAMRQAYQAQLRIELKRLGLPDRQVDLRDPSVVSTLKTEADDIAQSIHDTYNTMLSAQIDKQPAGLTELQIVAALASFFAGIHTYNRKVLALYASNYARNQAIWDLYTKNGIASTDPSQDGVKWTLEPDQTANIGDVCDQALEMSPMTTEQAGGFDFPAHRRCPHILVPVEIQSKKTDRLAWVG